MNDVNKNDWIRAGIESPNNTFGDFKMEGLTPQNTQLLNKDSYKEKDYIKQAFTNPENGKFDESRFSKFYDQQKESYNTFAKDEYDDEVLNGRYYWDTDFLAPKGAKRVTNYYSMGKEMNPFGNVAGTSVLNNRTASTFSVREVAQTQKVFDPKTGKYEDYTPNESGFWKSVFGADTLVLSQHEEDGEHYDSILERNVAHKKGDIRFNENGKPMYEKLGNRTTYGRNVLNPFDVMTTDGSWANKYDFMDSDGLSKSFSGTITKTAAQIMPYVIPKVKNVWTPMTLALQLSTDIFPTLSKSGASLLFGNSVADSDFVQSMNRLEGVGKRFQNSSSDEGRASTFNKENIFGMVGDVFGQIAQQRYIAKVPTWLGSTRAEAEVLKRVSATKSAQELSDLNKSLKGASSAERMALLRDAFGSEREVANILNKWDRFNSQAGKALGVSYMASISGTGMYEEAKLSGLDDRDAAAMTLGAISALGVLMAKTDIGEWTLKGIGLDDSSMFIKNAVKEQSGKIAAIANKSATNKVLANATEEAVEEATKSVSKAAWYSNLFNTGKNITTGAFNKLTNVIKNGGPVSRGSFSEALEEMSEEAIADSLKGIYNGMRQLGLTSTKDGGSFDVYDDGLSRYAMAAMGGAIGGGITGFSDSLGGRIHSSLPDGLTSELTSIITNGMATQFRNELKKQYKAGSLPGNPSLSPKAANLQFKTNSDPDNVDYETSSEDGISQNDFIYNILSSELDFLEKAIYQEGDVNSLELAPVYKLRESQLLDLKHNSAIRDDVDSLISQIVKIEAEIESTQGGIKDATQVETNLNNEKITRLKLQARPLRDQLNNILNGNNVDRYVGHAIFHMNPLLSSSYGVKTKEDYSQMVFNKPLSSLNVEEKVKLDEEYDDYTKYEKRNASKVGYAKFLRDQAVVANNFRELQKWGVQRRALLENDVQIGKVLTEEGEMIKFQSVYNSLLNLNQNLDEAVQAPSLQYTQTDIPVESGRNIFESYTNLLKKDAYINPELTAFLSNYLNKAVTPSMDSDGETIKDPSKIFSALIQQELRNNMEVPDMFFSEFFTAINSYLKKNKDKFNYKDFYKVIEDLNNFGFTDGAEIDTWLGQNLMNFYGMSIDTMSEQEKEKYINMFKNSFSQMLSMFEAAYTTGISKNEFNQIVAKLDDLNIANSKLEMFDSANTLDALLKERAVSPFHDMLNNLAMMDGVEGLGDMFDTIARQYSDLSNTTPEQFIISSKLDTSHLKYGRNVIERLKSLISASATWEESDIATNKIIGYASALNNLSIKGETFQEQPEFDLIDAETMLNDLAVVDQRLELLTGLSEFNMNGTVRESKVLGSRALTLYMDSLRPGSSNYELLESLGLDLDELSYLFDEASQYSDNISSINSTEDAAIPFDSSDAAVIKLRKEADRIEQHIYKMFNNPEEDAETRSERFRQAIDFIDLQDVDLSSRTSFNQRTKTIDKVQQLMYLFQSATIDTKQFYKDMAGDLDSATNDLSNSKIVPFLNQEIVIKQLYFSVMSKYKNGVDVYGNLINKLFPTRNASDSDRNPIYGNREDLMNLTSGIFLDGIPGAGKTSTATNFLNKMIARYNLTMATFAPYKEQIDNLNQTLEYTDNLVNPDGGTLDSLFNSVLGEELYGIVKQDLQNTTLDYKQESTVTLNADRVRTRMEQNPELNDRNGGFVKDSANTENPAISKFLNEFKRLSIDGKVPNVIVIDEATHIQVTLLDLLNRAITLHNNNADNIEKISLVLLGDTEQNGATTTLVEGDSRTQEISNLNFVNHISTPKLSQTFRSFYSTISDNINKIRTFREQVLSKILSTDSGNEKINNTLELKHTTDPELGLIGFKIAQDFDEIDIKNIFEKASDKVAIITNKLDSPVIGKIKGLGYTEDSFDIITPNNVQGLERDYAIIDLDSDKFFDINFENRFKFINEINSVYTALSRAKKGALMSESSTSAIKLNSNSENVSPFKIELNTSNLGKYKDLTVESINSSAKGLEDLEQHFSLNTNNAISFEAPETDEKEVADSFMDVATANVETIETPSKGNISVVNSTGENIVDEGLEQVMSAVETENTSNPNLKGTTLSYMYHERLGALTDPINGRIRNTGDIENYSTNDSDLMYLARLQNFVTEDSGIDTLNDNLKSLRSDLLNIRTAYMTWATNSDVGSMDFKPYLIKAGMNPRLVGQLGDLDYWKLKVLIKPYTKFDQQDSVSTNQESAFNGDISYLVLANPENDEQYITISALPNLNNPRLPKRIVTAMNDLYSRKSTIAGSGKAFFDYNGDIKQASNLVYHRSEDSRPETVSYSELLANNGHLNISEPFILSGDLFTSAESTEIDQYLKDMSLPLTSTTDSKHRLRGLPFVLVSTNKNVNSGINPMVAHYKKQVKASKTSQEFLPGDTRLLMLKPKTRSFSEWFNWNAELGIRYNSGEQGLSKDLAAAENNYVAAKILSRFTLMLSAYNKAKSELAPGATINYRTFLPDSIARPGKVGNTAEQVNDRVDAFMSKIQNLMNYAVPASMNMTYLGYIGKLSSYSIDKGSDINIAMQELYKRDNVEIKELQNNFYAGEQKGATTKALEHYVAKRMLGFINNKVSNTEVELIDFNESQVPLNKVEKGSLINMVVALRTAIDGGTIKLNGEDIGVYQKGLFRDPAEKQSFLKQLDAVITNNNTETFSSLFPGGINSNITYRRRNDSNKFTGALPFNMETGVNNTEFDVEVNLQLPKLFVDFGAVDLNGSTQRVIESDDESVTVKTLNDVMNNHYSNKVDALQSKVDNFANKLNLESVPVAVNHDSLPKNENLTSEAEAIAAAEKAYSEVLASTVEELNRFTYPEVLHTSRNTNSEQLTDVSEFEIISGVSEDGQSGFGIISEPANIIIDQYAKDNNIFETLSEVSPKFKEMVDNGGKPSFKTKDGSTIFYVVENAENSEIFGKFVLQTEEDAETNKVNRIKSPFEVLNADTKSLDLTDFNNLKTHAKNMLGDNKELLAKFNDFVNALELSIESDFTAINNKDSIRELSSAYLEASIALKSDPVALKALQNFYKDFTNTNKC